MNRALLDHFLHSRRGGEGVGHMHVLQEPFEVTSYLGTTESVPVVEKTVRTIPVKPIQSITDIFPPVPLQSPKAGETRYFCYHNKSITSVLVNSVVRSSCMGGLLCNSQSELLVEARKCGCFDKNRYNTDRILDVDITFPVEETFELCGAITIPSFRSRRFSNVIVANWTGVQAASQGQEESVRNAADSVIRTVNDNGGWTIIGWLQTGIAQDSSSRDAGG